MPNERIPLFSKVWRDDQLYKFERVRTLDYNQPISLFRKSDQRELPEHGFISPSVYS